MNHEQAMSFALKQITERIEEIGAEARRAKEDGDDDRNTAARNFQNGFIECAEVIEKLLLLVGMTGGEASMTGAEGGRNAEPIRAGVDSETN